MLNDVDLRELRVFVTLTDQLHFGRTARILGLTQSRVSQSLRALESKVGVPLFTRTSRRVELTAAGRQLDADLRPALDAVRAALQHASQLAIEHRIVLRLGLFNAGSGGPLIHTIIDAFQARHPCDVQIVELPFNDRFGPLRRHEIDLMATRLPLAQPDLYVGPRLTTDKRVLGVSRAHPLAQRSSVSIEDVADYSVSDIDTLPVELIHAIIPINTPSGRPIPRRHSAPRSTSELLMLVASGRVVHPTVESFGHHLSHPGVVYVPIDDMEPLASALVWRRGDTNPDLAAFTAHVAQTIDNTATKTTPEQA